MDNQGKYILKYGIHGGTLMSRDFCEPYEFDTEKEAIEKAKELRKYYYEKFQYYIWFANITRPDGTVNLNVIRPVPYER